MKEINSIIFRYKNAYSYISKIPKGKHGPYKEIFDEIINSKELILLKNSSFEYGKLIEENILMLFSKKPKLGNTIYNEYQELKCLNDLFYYVNSTKFLNEMNNGYQKYSNLILKFDKNRTSIPFTKKNRELIKILSKAKEQNKFLYGVEMMTIWKGICELICAVNFESTLNINEIGAFESQEVKYKGYHLYKVKFKNHKNFTHKKFLLLDGGVSYITESTEEICPEGINTITSIVYPEE